MQHTIFYPLGDRYPEAEKGKQYHAVATGDFHPPRKGEWYLSGAKVAAYQAPNGMSTPYHIARVVETERITIIRDVHFKQSYSYE